MKRGQTDELEVALMVQLEKLEYCFADLEVILNHLYPYSIIGTFVHRVSVALSALRFQLFELQPPPGFSHEHPTKPPVVNPPPRKKTVAGLAIKFNNCSSSAPCAICGSTVEPEIGYELFAANSYDLVCHECGRKLEPAVVAILEGKECDRP